MRSHPDPRTVPAAAREEISALVEKCLEAKGVGCEEFEREIDERVAALYGLESIHVPLRRTHEV
ncbi:MAG: hypothetical protein M3397_05475 [Actinomycetota bacterium]|nr:hypothetical protein [Rubrobacter sp.]MBA3790273.1 hypothetical protein [Rubrobacter sp.]MDQ3238712.1 hypothetical protein [Actinomycetota bacterium]MDQ3567514.1 hypothetical protein [Actinomycetota bacterium]